MSKPNKRVSMTQEDNAVDTIFDADALETLKEGLAIDQHDLDSSLLEQPQNFYHVAQAVSLWTSRRDAAKQALALLEAKFEKDIRHDAEIAKEKITVSEVESEKRMDKAIQAAQTELLKYNHTVASFSNLKEAYQQRGYVLKELVSLYTVSYYAVNQSQGSVGPGARDRAAEEGRQAMHRERVKNRSS